MLEETRKEIEEDTQRRKEAISFMSEVRTTQRSSNKSLKGETKKTTQNEKAAKRFPLAGEFNGEDGNKAVLRLINRFEKMCVVNSKQETFEELRDKIIPLLHHELSLTLRKIRDHTHRNIKPTKIVSLTLHQGSDFCENFKEKKFKNIPPSYVIKAATQHPVHPLEYLTKIGKMPHNVKEIPIDDDEVNGNLKSMYPEDNKLDRNELS